MTLTFGQMVIGPPASGKSTYCREMAKFLSGSGRKVAIINIDPANDKLPYEAAVDINELIKVEDVMTYNKLGPNGGLLFAIEYLESNLNWLLEQLTKCKGQYLIFDCPGQIELYTHHESMKNIIAKLQENNYGLCALHLIDSHYCSDPGKFLSALILTLTTMMNIELPHVNVLTKVDLMVKFAHKLPFSLEFYTEVLNLDYLIECLDGHVSRKYKKFNAALMDIVERYGLVSFLPLNIQDGRMLNNVKRSFDKANGYIYQAGEQSSVQSLLACAVGAQTESDRIGIDRDLYTAANNEDTMDTTD